MLIWLVLGMEPEVANREELVFRSCAVTQLIAVLRKRGLGRSHMHCVLLLLFYRGGVFTPGAAFSRTKLIDRLNQHGIEFSVISSSEV